MIDWTKHNISLKEREWITEIALRAETVASHTSRPFHRGAVLMIIEACHCHGNPLKLEEFSATTGEDFAHDVFGIRDNIDLKTGKLQNGFRPRFSANLEPDPAAMIALLSLIRNKMIDIICMPNVEIKYIDTLKNLVDLINEVLNPGAKA